MLTLPRKVYLLVALSFVYLTFSFLAAGHSDINLWFSLIPIALSTAAITIISPPVAAAMVFMSHNLTGLINIHHPGFMFQLIPAGSMLIPLVYIRRKDFLNLLSNPKTFRPQTWALLAMYVIFFIGSIKAISNQFDIFSLKTFISLFKVSNGGSAKFYPYVFMSRWTLFILIGALCCRGKEELKFFFFCLSFFVVAQLLAIPGDIFGPAVSDWWHNRYNQLGLQTQNINRAYLGYLLALASFIMMTFGVYEKKNRSSVLYGIAALLFLFICFIAGSRGPLLAFGLATGFLILQDWKRISKVAIFFLAFLVFYKILPMAYGIITSPPAITSASPTTEAANLAHSQVGSIDSSISIRADLAAGVMKKINLHSLFGNGFGSSIVAVEIHYKDPMFEQMQTFMTGSGSHNLFLDFLADLGIVGVSTFVISLFILISNFIKESNADSKENINVSLMGGVLLILLVFSILATSPALATIQALMIGVLYGVGIKPFSSPTK